MSVDEPRAGRREYLGLAVLSLPTLLLALDLFRDPRQRAVAIGVSVSGHRRVSRSRAQGVS